MARDTIVKDGIAHYALWLVFEQSGGVRMTRGQPDCDRDERAVALTVKLPTALFRTPVLAATLTIDAAEAPAQQIDVAAASEALKSVLGCDIDVVIREPTE